MTSIVKTITKFIGSIILLFGLYLILHGHLQPGGGFEGGIALGTSFILITLAYGKEVMFDKINQLTGIILQSLGVIIFLTVAFLGYYGGFFLRNYFPKGIPFGYLSGGDIPLISFGIGLATAFAIWGAFIALTSFRIIKDPRQKS
jgi:multicomponent Na+:H+ antiporter subunit B